MKHQFSNNHAYAIFVNLLLISFSYNHSLLGQCNTCTYTVSSNNNSYFNLNSGDVLCITNTGNFTGQLNLMAGAAICNQGTLSPSGFNIGAGTLDNYGTINFNSLFNVNSGAIVNNYGTINANGNFELNQTSVFNNLGGALNIGGNCGFDNNSSYTQTSGSFTANSTVAVNNNSLINFTGGTVTMLGNLNLNNPSCTLNLDVSTSIGNNVALNSGHLAVNNQCSLTIGGNYNQNGASIYVNHYVEVSGNFTHNSGNVHGPTTGCSRITVAGNSTNYGPGVFGNSGNIDFCDLGNPNNGWDSNWGSLGSGVTFCTCMPSANQSSQWAGTNSNWHDASNWSNSNVPTSTTSVTIPAGMSLYPIISADAEVFDLTISPGTSLIVGSGYDLSVFGDFNGNGCTHTSGTIVFEGASSQLISGVNYFHNLSIDNVNNVTANDDFFVAGLLNCVTGNLDVNSKVITLQSGAVLMDVTGGVIGDLTAERTVPNPDGYHYLTSPFSGNSMVDLNDDFTLISLGGDVHSTPLPNIWYYDETNPSSHSADGWTVPANLNYPMSLVEGFAFKVDAGITLDLSGPVHTGTITKPLTFTPSNNNNIICPPDGWHLLGNPYLAPIDWELATLVGVDKGIYFWSPDILQYASYIDGVFVNGGTRYISSFQAFFVRSNAAGAFVEFSDNMKVADPYLNSTFKSNNVVDSILRISLTGPMGIDETVVRFSQSATDGFDANMEAYKMLSGQSGIPNIGSMSQGTNYSVNALPINFFKDTIPLFFKAGSAGVYTLKLDSSSLFLNEVDVWLKDAQSNTIHFLENGQYTFNSIANVESYRFSLIVDRLATSQKEVLDESESIQLYCDNKNLIISAQIDMPDTEIIIYNTLGQSLLQKGNIFLTTDAQVIDISSLESGIYLVSVLSDSISSKWIRIP